jgi:hypothetical protein
VSVAALRQLANPPFEPQGGWSLKVLERKTALRKGKAQFIKKWCTKFIITLAALA